MTVVSDMRIRVRPHLRTEAMDAFVRRRVFEECADAIPGFRRARLLAAQGDPDVIAVIAEWTDAAAFDDWMKHPARARQEADLARFLDEPARTTLLSAAAEYERGR